MTCSGCGYHILQAPAPFRQTHLCVHPYGENMPFGLAGELTHHVDRLLAMQGITLSRACHAEDALLSGLVVAATTGISPNGIGIRISAYQLSASILSILRAPNGDVLWQFQTDARENFLPPQNQVVFDALAIEANRRNALVRLAQNAAHTIVAQLIVANWQFEHAQSENSAKNPTRTLPPLQNPSLKLEPPHEEP